MKKIAIICLALIAASISLIQNASAYSVTLKDFEGGDTEVTLDINQTSTSKVQVTAQVSSGIADIQGLFFNFTDIFAKSDLIVTGSDKSITDIVYNNDSVIDIGNGATMKGTGSVFDLGLKIGTAGIGKDDIASTSFTIESLSGKAVTFTSDFGARLTSVGVNRQDSSKLLGTYNQIVPPAAIPEPTTLLLVGIGILGIAGLRKRILR